MNKPTVNKPIWPPLAKTTGANGARLEKLVARWWELAEIGYPRDGTKQAGWAEHLERLAAEPTSPDGDQVSDPAPDSQPAKDENQEPQSTRESLAVEGVLPFLAMLSQRR